MNIDIKLIKTDRFSVKYFKFGSGNKIFVILPGLSIQSVMNSAAAVANEYHLLTKDFTVYVFDRIENIPTEYSIADMARDSAETLNALGLKDVYLFGASQGGMIAMMIAARYPHLVKKLIIGSASAQVDNTVYSVIERWINLAVKKDGVALYDDFGKTIYPSDFYLRNKTALEAAGKTVTDEEFKRFITLARGIKGFSVEEMLKDIKCPVFVIGAADDAVLGESAADNIIKRLKNNPGLEYYIYNCYGHAAFDTAPDYRKRILDFCLKS